MKSYQAHMSVLGEYRSLVKQGSSRVDSLEFQTRLYKSVVALMPMWIALSNEENVDKVYAAYGAAATLYYEFYNEFVANILHEAPKTVDSKVRYELVKRSVGHLLASQQPVLKLTQTNNVISFELATAGTERSFGKERQYVEPTGELLYAQHHPFVARLMSNPNAINDMVNSLLAMSCLVDSD